MYTSSTDQATRAAEILNQQGAKWFDENDREDEVKDNLSNYVRLSIRYGQPGNNPEIYQSIPEDKNGVVQHESGSPN